MPSQIPVLLQGVHGPAQALEVSLFRFSFWFYCSQAHDFVKDSVSNGCNWHYLQSGFSFV